MLLFSTGVRAFLGGGRFTIPQTLWWRGASLSPPVPPLAFLPPPLLCLRFGDSGGASPFRASFPWRGARRRAKPQPKPRNTRHDAHSADMDGEAGGWVVSLSRASARQASDWVAPIKAQLPRRPEKKWRSLNDHADPSSDSRTIRGPNPEGLSLLTPALAHSQGLRVVCPAKALSLFLSSLHSVSSLVVGQN